MTSGHEGAPGHAPAARCFPESPRCPLRRRKWPIHKSGDTSRSRSGTGARPPRPSWCYREIGLVPASGTRGRPGLALRPSSRARPSPQRPLSPQSVVRRGPGASRSPDTLQPRLGCPALSRRKTTKATKTPSPENQPHPESPVGTQEPSSPPAAPGLDLPFPSRETAPLSLTFPPLGLLVASTGVAV